MFPFLQIGGTVISTYYLLISIGCFAGLSWFFRRTPPKDESAAINLALVSLISGFVGARLLHVVFEQPGFYFHNPIRIFEIWQGGFVFYGGLICGLIGGITYARIRKLDVPRWLDRSCLPLSLGYAIGRLGCFANGCCYGHVCFLPWAVRFPSHHLWKMAVQPRHPTQLYAVAGEIVLMLALSGLEKSRAFATPGRLFSVWLVLHAMNRIVMEHWRDDDRGAFILGASISTWISVALILVGLTVLTVLRNRRPLQVAA